jgi:flagellin
MALRINYNLAASVAQRSLGASQDTYARQAEKLATGLRINKAGDDAAGMAVSERLKNQVRGLNVAGRNAQDGVSLVQTAEGALAETHTILGRLRELAVQAANDTLNATDRANLQTEANQLVSEIDRIAASTQFNGLYLLNKNSNVSLHDAGDGLQFQIGANESAASNQVTVTVAGVRSQDLGDVSTINTIDSSATTGAKTVTLGTSAAGGVKYNTAVDTIFDLRDAINAASTGVTASVITSGGNTDGNGGNTVGTASGAKLKLTSSAARAFSADSGNVAARFFGSATATTAQVAAGSASTLADMGVAADGTLTITASIANSVAAGANATVQELGATAGTMTVVIDNAAGNSDVSSSSRTATVTYALTDTLTSIATSLQAAIRALPTPTTSGAGGASNSSATVTWNSTPSQLAIASGSANLIATIGGTGTLHTVLGLAASPAATSEDGSATNVAAQSETVTVSYALTDTTATLASNIQTALRAAGAVGNSTLSTGTLAAAAADFGATTGQKLTITKGAGSSVAYAFTDTNTGGTSLITKMGLASAAAGSSAASSSTLTEANFTLYSKTVTGVTSISSGTNGILDIGTQTAASASIATVDSAINQVSTARAGLGALQSRLESASRSIAIASENAAAANSRIADADIAESMSSLVRAQILQQAGISVLAQANQAPSLVLQLLK